MLIKLQNRSGQALTFNFEGRMRHLPPGAGAVMTQDSIGPEIRMLLTEGILEASPLGPAKAVGARQAEMAEAFGAESGTTQSALGRHASRDHEKAKHDKSGKSKER
jgi:hypothetical protein